MSLASSALYTVTNTYTNATITSVNAVNVAVDDVNTSGQLFTVPAASRGNKSTARWLSGFIRFSFASASDNGNSQTCRLMVVLQRNCAGVLPPLTGVGGFLTGTNLPEQAFVSMPVVPLTGNADFTVLAQCVVATTPNQSAGTGECKFIVPSTALATSWSDGTGALNTVSGSNLYVLYVADVKNTSINDSPKLSMTCTAQLAVPYL